MQDQTVALLRTDLLAIFIDTAFLVIGLASCAIAAMRQRKGVRLFLWIGIWSATYGLMHLLDLRAVETALPPSLRAMVPYVVTSMTYLVVVIASIAWLELVTGTMRSVVIALVVAASITAVLGIGSFVAAADSERYMWLNNSIAAAILLGLLIVLSSKKLFNKYLLLPERGFLMFGTIVFALEALVVNLMRPLFGRASHPTILDDMGFLVLLVAFGHSGLRLVMSNEHRLLQIETELQIAREIQASILPAQVPQIQGLRICATYRPMTSVAGDFYEFLPLDDHRAGILLADVCGHGVPAALIASMLKVAVQSVTDHADSPCEFLSALNRILAAPLHGQLVSASYLFVDTRAHTALYSAAGHPPLLRVNHTVESIESNGLLFGITHDAGYPVTKIPLCSGDRLLLYTDGVTDPEDRAGVAFGDGELQRILSENRADDPAQLSTRIVSGIQSWQQTTEPQDDMTFIVVDVE